ncbi:UTP--glucose-1-phosphate uridylyltransferase GalU [Rubellimicrobium roseum]|uniref:UTP--glucose-1-phosphate uridylyltransferase n=1 Tax=Rubellimicrobium roseum TaxID=687525 RepID=A0A5C4N930_9RHOB|nr:UTP--glucose-1-phosphate uridylyltransferase GalU [Rubellimicrobium roseum]TNC66575.1 UTP--glucose-1-phosphate uridylyltransferase GalU [Rubellimicrobium roseum]
MKPVTKAIFPVAGLGTRFLPATKAQPKEMLTVIDKPLIQFAVEEAIAAGVTQLIFVTGRTKRAIADHFDATPELDRLLRDKGKAEVADALRGIIPPQVTCIYIRQPEALGLGHAVACAAPLIGDDEPFAVLLADDLMQGEPPVLAQMTEVHRATGRSVLAVNPVPEEEASSYGVVAAEDPGEGGSAAIRDMVEKPPKGEAPSNLAVVGRYILTPEIMGILARQEPGRGGEIQLTDAIRQLVSGTGVEAYRYRGRRYDCGSKMGYLEATLEMGLAHPDYGPALKARLREVLDGGPDA